MTRGISAKYTVAMVFACVLVASVRASSWANWVVDENGQCVEKWVPSDAVQGPTAIINGVMMPVRSVAGAIYLGGTCVFDNNCKIRVSEVWMAPVFLVLSTVAGIIEGTSWVVRGAGDTITGGAFHLTPDEAGKLSIMPVIQLPDARRTPYEWGYEDRCGRPLKDGKLINDHSSSVQDNNVLN